MTHRVEVLLFETDHIGTDLGEFETAVEARTACAQHAGGMLSWSQPEEGVWEAEGVERWYRVIDGR